MRWLLLTFLLLPAGSGAQAAGPRPQLARPSLVAPLFIDDQPREQAWVFPDSRDDRFLIEAEPLLASVSQELPAGRIEALRRRVDARGLLSLRSLRAEGLRGEFSEATLELRLRVPPELRSRAVKSVVERGETPSGKIHGPAAFSGYLSARSSQPWAYPSHLGQPGSRQPLGANLDFAANVRSWALVSGATYTERDAAPWRREDTALVRDFESPMLRLTLGDQQTPTTAYLTGRGLGGAGLARVFSIRPYETTQPVSRTELLLKRPSSVEVIVNGVVQKQLRLPAGPVNVQDFPLASGFNNVALRITDDLGRTEVVNLNLFYNPESLGAGVNLFSYQVGAPWSPVRSDRHYDSRDLNFSFFHRAGLSDSFTGGVFGQGDTRQKLGGFDGLWVGRYGSTGFTLAGSSWRAGRGDFAGRLRYETLDGARGRSFPWRFSLESEYKGWHFAQVGSVPVNLFSWTLDAYSLYRSGRGIDFGLGAGYRFRRTNPVDRWEGRSDLSGLLGRDIRLSVAYSYASDLQREHRVFASLTWIEPSGRHYVNSTYDYPSKTARLDAVRNPKQSFDDARLAASASRSPETDQASIQAEYTAQRALLRLDHQSSFPRHGSASGGGTQHLTTAGLGTALVWAGTTVSITRPVSDSFAIFSAAGSAQGQQILVNPQGDSAETYVGGFLPGVMPNVAPYYYTPVSLDTSRMPLGMSVPEEYFHVKTGYKSGAKVTVGAELSLTVIGTLQLEGKPVALASGEIVPAGAERGPVFFTGRRGQFVAEGIQPGRYELRFYEGELAPVPFSVPKGASGVLRLGNLKVRKAR